MTLTGLEPELERALDLAGVLVFALSGASLAVRRDAPQAAAIAAAVLVVRLLAIRRGWRAPTART